MVSDELQKAVWAAYRVGQERDKRPTKHYLIVTARARIMVAENEGMKVPNGFRTALEIWERHEREDAVTSAAPGHARRATVEQR